jgi:uncharacterized protein YjaG (DUF416 family)
LEEMETMKKGHLDEVLQLREQLASNLKEQQRETKLQNKVIKKLQLKQDEQDLQMQIYKKTQEALQHNLEAIV